MPVVIKELHIKVNVEENSSPRISTAQQESGSSRSDDLVDVCVEKVLEVLKQKKRR